MFKSISNNFSRKKYVKLLAFVVAATASEVGYGMVPEKDADTMATSEPTLVSVNKEIKDTEGNVAVKATDAGIAASNAAAAQAAPPAPAEPKQEFKIDSGVALPEIQRGGVRGDVYPFQKLEVGQSFFIAATEKRPNPSKSLGSTVSSASRRYKGQTPERKFTIRAVDEGGVKGARIWRTV